MASLIPGYEYDIFISYRQKDNKYDGWVTDFVDHLKAELESTFRKIYPRFLRIMKISRFLTIMLFFLFLHFGISAQDYPFLKDPAGLSEISVNNGIEKPVTIRVIYDNYTKKEELKPDWGYSIVIDGLDKTVLFDARANPAINKPG